MKRRIEGDEISASGYNRWKVRLRPDNDYDYDLCVAKYVRAF
jgi:hypothetical protein